MATTTLPKPASLPGTRSRLRERSPASPVRHIDVVLGLAVLAVAALGVLFVYSATRGPVEDGGLGDTSYLWRQAMYVGVGSVVMAVLAAVDYRRWRRLAPLVYLATLILLGLVLSPLGSESKGAQAWFELGAFQLQPSELGKVGLIVTLASYLALRRDDLQLRHLIVALVIAGLPMGLILLQPDLGTALVFVAITLGMLLVGGAQARHIFIATVLGVAGVLVILNSDVLAEYQKDRLTGFTNPSADVQGDTWNQNQSLITIGAGGVTGQGLFEGPQTRSGQVPEQETDFIFTVVGEELGFVGAATVLLLYALIIWRIWRIAHLSRDQFGSLLCVGVMAMFMFQVFQSVGMTVGIMPVTGIPLPLFSFGGSSSLASFAALGLVMGVHMHRFK